MLSSTRVPHRARLVYRDIASATNRLTLIAAVVPASAVTTHTLFCLKTPLRLDAQHVLCALLNSLVANYFVRMRVNTHVTVSLVSRLPVPLFTSTDPLFTRLSSLSKTLSTAVAPVDTMTEYAELQALVARSYGLSGKDFQHILSTFPLIAEEVRKRCFGQSVFADHETPRHRGCLSDSVFRDPSNSSSIGTRYDTGSA
jgi:hypothetical protein